APAAVAEGAAPRVRSVDVLAFHINHFFRLHGVEVCNLLALVVALVRLNAVAIIYFIFFLALGTRRRRPRIPEWRLYIAIQTVLLFYQYASALGLPPHVDYPWARASYALSALLRWLYLPLTHVGEANGIPRGPRTWNGTDVL